MWVQKTVENFPIKAKRYKKSENNLQVHVFPSGKKTYYAFINRKDKYIGDCNLISLKEAKGIRDKYLQESRIGIKEETKLTLKEFIETKDFLDWSVMKRTSHKERMESVYGVIVPFLGNIKLTNINLQAVTRYVNHRASVDKAKPSTIERNLTDLRAILRCAKDFEYINNLLKIPSQVTDEGIEPRILSDKEITRLREAVSEETTSPNHYEYHVRKRKHMPLIIELALETGGRKSEILQLTWGDILDKGTDWKELTVSALLEESEEATTELEADFKILQEMSPDSAMIQFRGTTTKSQQTRRVPISSVVIDMLMEWYMNYSDALTREEFLELTEQRFEDTGKIRAIRIRDEDNHKRIFPMKDIKTAFNSAKKRANLDKEVTFHSLRHTFCTRALDHMNITDVMKLAGHSDIRTTQQYLHLDTEKIVRKHTDFVNSISRTALESDS